MKVAIHINASLHRYTESFNTRFALLLADKSPENEFILIIDGKASLPDSLPRNARQIELFPSIKNRLLAKFWYDIRLPKLLKRESIDLLITAGDIFSLNCSIQQICLLHAAENLKKSYQGFTKRRQLKTSAGNIIPAIISNRATPSFTYPVTAYLRPGPVFPEAINSNRHFDMTSETETGYFIFLSHGRHDPNLILVMKAFSIFKKWQRSSLKLVMITDAGKVPVIPGLSNYKYRNDVILPETTSVVERKQWIKNAFAGICFGGEAIQDPVWELCEAGIPVIAASTSVSRLFWQDTALFSPLDEKALSELLMSLYKNDEWRAELRKKAADLARLHNWELFAEALLKLISNRID